MTNPHAPPFAKPSTSHQAHQHCAGTHKTVHGLLCLTLGLSMMVTGGSALAQSVDVLEWQPGQSTLLTVISTPHNDVRKLLRQAKYPQALQLVNKALATNPRDPQMRFWQGFVFEQLGQPDMALQVYLDLTREYPELAEPFNNLGVIYAAKGDYPNAKASLDAALRANPNYASAHENMGDLLVNMARQSYERSLAIDAKQRGLTQKIERLTPVLAITQGKP
nr:tetratricopeptide repeat protein [uncultured Limnohabitans sp.]